MTRAAKAQAAIAGLVRYPIGRWQKVTDCSSREKRNVPTALLLDHARRPMISNPRDFVAGLAMLFVAGWGYWLTRNLGGFTGSQLGPGSLPRLVCGFLALLSIILVGRSFLTSGERLPSLPVRGPALILGSILLFAFLVEPLGIVITIWCSASVASLASPRRTLLEFTLFPILLSFSATLLFVYALSLPLPVWPRF